MRESVNITAERWFNAEQDFSLKKLRGQVVALHTFQLLCPGCVQQSLPQMARLESMSLAGLAIVGLHTVFEHHAAMGPEILAAFLHENRIAYPVAVDAHVAGQAQPLTMAALGLRGTPSLLLLDRQLRERYRHFGVMDDLALGTVAGTLLAEPSTAESKG